MCSANSNNFTLTKSWLLLYFISGWLQYIPGRFLNKLSKEGTHYDCCYNIEEEDESFLWPSSSVVNTNSKLKVEIVEQWNVECGRDIKTSRFFLWLHLVKFLMKMILKIENKMLVPKLLEAGQFRGCSYIT